MLKRYIMGAVAALAFSSSASSANAATTIISEDFEATPYNFTFNGNVFLANGAIYGPCCGTPADTSNTFVAFGGGNAPSGNILSTSFNTFLGSLYTVNFDFKAFGGGSESLTFQVGSQTHTVNPIADNTLNFSSASFNFLGTGALTTLKVFSGGVNNVDAAVDNITISAVPEPELWAMMIFGFGLIGLQMRRRRKLITVTA